ncbi:MAG: hypothetical protein CR984_02545 [Proteobacteria bacterium]|nr:MAG: hypothetical protein CR984_02545 [Pseudomonadota bacterium]
MTDKQQAESMVDRTGDALFQFAIDRNDMHAILDALPPTAADKRSQLEYEIQLLRIVAVGWAITYYLADHAVKTTLGQYYWEAVRSLSATLSTSASTAAGAEVDYFDIIRQRMDHYVKALDAAGQITDPTLAIGPAFAEASGDRDDACAMLAGSKMFAHTIRSVRDHLDTAVARQDNV